MKTKNYKGQCFCGTVQYKLLEAPMFINCCHCTDCQNQTGGAFVINGLIETHNIKKIKGTLERIAMAPKKARPHDIYRCKKCKVALWSDYGRRPTLRFVRISTLNKPHNLKPNAHVFTRSKLPWIKLSKDIPSFKIFYKMSQLWPKKSLQRRAEILGPLPEGY